MIQPEHIAARRKLPLPVMMFAVVSLLNEVSAQMVAPLIPILLVSVLAAGPVTVGAVEGIADTVAAFLKLWSGRHADVRPQRCKAMVFVGYGLALASRPLIGLAGNWGTVIALRVQPTGWARDCAARRVMPSLRDTAWQTLLLGNGASIAIHGDFGYPTLHSVADAKGLLPTTAPISPDQSM